MLAEKFPEVIGKILVNLVTTVADLTCDVKKEVKAAAVICMRAICSCTGNRDLEPFLPAVIDAAQSLANTHACVDKLAGCIFVQNVECPALAATLPVLARGLNDKSEEVKRTCCQIVDNMCKLVEDPAEVLPLMPRLEPLVKAATKSKLQRSSLRRRRRKPSRTWRSKSRIRSRKDFSPMMKNGRWATNFRP